VYAALTIDSINFWSEGPTD